MQQLTSSSLFQALSSLTELSGQLSLQLAQVAKRLHEMGKVPSETLLEEVATFRQRFLDLSTRGLAVAETLAIPGCHRQKN